MRERILVNIGLWVLDIIGESSIIKERKKEIVLKLHVHGTDLKD